MTSSPMDDAAWYAETHKQLAAWADTMGMAFAGGSKAFQAAHDFAETCKSVADLPGSKKEPPAADWPTESRRRLRLVQRLFKPAEVTRIKRFIDDRGRA
jgi:hypothetical protein